MTRGSSEPTLPGVSEAPTEAARPCGYEYGSAYQHRCIRDHRHNPPHRCACGVPLPSDFDEEERP